MLAPRNTVGEPLSFDWVAMSRRADEKSGGAVQQAQRDIELGLVKASTRAIREAASRALRAHFVPLSKV